MGHSGAGYLLKSASMPDAVATTHLLVMNQANAVDTNSAEPVQFWLGAVGTGVKSFWLNEGGNPRSEAYGGDQVPLKVFGHSAGNDQTANLQEWYGGDGALKTRIGAAGRLVGGYGDWTSFTSYVNGYGAGSGSTLYAPAGRLDPGGDIVRLRGEITCDGTAGASEVVCTLPSALRPSKQVRFNICGAPASAGSGSMTIDTDGTMNNLRALSYTSIFLDGLTYSL